MRIHPDPDPQPCPDHYIFLNDVNFEDIFLSFPTGARFLLSCLKKKLLPVPVRYLFFKCSLNETLKIFEPNL